MLLKAGQDCIEVDPLRGGRIASFRISGLSVIVEEGPSDLEWGCYPMVPWAGRVRHGKFSWFDRTVELPLRMPPHAIHGTVLDRAWDVLDGHHLESDLGDDWPWQGRVQSSFEMEEGRFCWRLGLSSDASQMPAMMGWHPWFWKSLADGSLATLHFDAESIYERDQEGLPSGKRAQPGSGPFDDCFTGLRSPPRIRWSNGLNLEVSSTCDHWVLYDEPEHAFCVEPLTGPPNSFNQGEFDVVGPDAPLVHSMTWRWWTD